MADVDRAKLNRYIDLEREIQQHEGAENLKKFDDLTRQIEDVTHTIKAMEINLAQLEINTKKEERDVKHVTTIRDMFKTEMEYDKQLTLEREEYLEALNKEEVAKQNIAGLKKQKAEYEAALENIKGPAQHLKNLYEERDTLLSDIFNGEYGSELENKLEAQYDELVDRRQRVSVAHYKWTEAQNLLKHAVKQLGHAVIKWREVPGCKMNQQTFYATVTEVRNNLIAAVQNVNSTQRYLHTIEFPYCAPQEMETLGRAINNIYTDANSPDRHNHAHTCYDTTYKRANALLQWFDNVIRNTIQKDQANVVRETEQVEEKLRAERVRLIRAKVEESGGNVKDINTKGLMGKTDQKKVKDEAGSVVPFQAETVKNKETDISDVGQMKLDEREPPPPTPVPLNALAPPPSQDEIFGNIYKIKSEHEKHKEDFEKAQDLNKARMEQSLQNKINNRRQRKQRF